MGIRRSGTALALMQSQMLQMATYPVDTVKKWVRDTKLARKMYPNVLEERDGEIYVDTGIEELWSPNDVFKQHYGDKVAGLIPACAILYNMKNTK